MSAMESLSDILPSNVMVKILACLPARSLVRFRCVSKSWRLLLSKPYFVTEWMKHCGTSLLVVPLGWKNRDQCSLVFENVSIGKKNMKLPIGMKWLSLSLVGSSEDGALICLTGLSYVSHQESKQVVILWSPFTGEVKILGNEGLVHCCHRVCIESLVHGYNSACCHQYLVHGFGYELNDLDYKVVRITYSTEAPRQAYSPVRPWHAEVYSLSKDAWKSLGRPDFSWMVRGNSQALVNGSVHWLAAPSANAPYNSILPFNMREELFKEVIELPQPSSLWHFSLNPRGKATLSVSRGSLALIAFKVSNQEECGIWVMNDYGVAESWTKQHQVVLPIGSTVRAALGLTGHGKILLRMVDEKLLCCDVEDMQISEVGIQGGSTESSFDAIDLRGADPTLSTQVDLSGGIWGDGEGSRCRLHMGRILTSDEENVVWNGVKHLHKVPGLFKFVWETAGMNGVLELQGHLWCIRAKDRTLTYKGNLYFVHGITL